MPIRFQSAKLLRLFLTADECKNNQSIFKISWLTSMILRRFSYSEKYVSQDKTEICETKKGRSNASPHINDTNRKTIGRQSSAARSLLASMLCG